MTPPSQTADTDFSVAARQVQHRLTLRKVFLLLLRTWPWAAGVTVLLLVSRLLGAGFATPAFLWVSLSLWAAGCALWAWKSKPDPYSALAFWDKAAKRSDDFANAWWLQRQAEVTAGGRLHVQRQSALLPQALPVLKNDVPMPDVRWLGLFLLAAVGIVFLPHVGSWQRPDPELTSEGRKLAEEAGKKLAERKLDVGKMQGLEEQEKKELEKLQQKVQDTAQALQSDSKKTAREVLAELEQRARDAEKMAEKLGAGDAAWASEQMTAEMRKHADTSDLGDAIAAKNAQNTANKAQDMADKLKDEKLTSDTKERLTETMKEVGAKAQPEDKERTAGQHIINADKNLAQTLPQDAGKEFQALADKMRTLAQREKAREELEKLASQLRESGSDIAGQNQKGMQQLAGSQNQGQQNQSGQQPQQGQQSQPGGMMAMPNAPQMQPMQMPGMSNAPQGNQGQSGNSQNMPMMTPVPGSGHGQKMAISPNSGQPSNSQANKPMLFAPIPGTQPGQQPNAAIMGMMPGMSQGGLQAGNGTTDLGKSPTAKTAAGQQATVNAQRNAEGASSVRTVEGQARPEQAGRGSQATVFESISAEENALDDAALPAARREQVRRYFTELRKRFEKEN